MARDNLLGLWGETLAADFLRKHGYRILDCNYRCRFGEIDLIAQKSRYLVFVEVKLRKSVQFGEAKEFVGYSKQNKIRAAAEMWLQAFPNRHQPRFDVIEIYAPQGRDTADPQIIHLEDAFS